MSAMGMIEAQELGWLAVRVKRKQPGGIRSIRVGGDFEAYKDRQGRVRKRRINGTGKRVFLPEHLLRRAGFETFLPIEKKLQKINRLSPEKHLVEYPLFVNWMFVGWPRSENRWARLMELDVVTGVLGTGGRPLVIPTIDLVDVMDLYGAGYLSPAVHRFVRTGVQHEVGDVVRVLDGPFVDFPAKVVDVNGPSVKALVNIFGKDVQAEFGVNSLGVAVNS
jgi:transcription termination/antitermination protein NusG